MAICKLCKSSSAMSTAKLILEDGGLQEFPYPVKASYVLQKIDNCFICNSDDMDFHGVVSAVGGDEELQPGQLYFALPLSRLNRRLQPEDMAALAVKASAALSHVSGGDCSCRNVEEYGGDRGLKAAGGDRRRGGAGRRVKLAARLSGIPE